MSSLLSRSPNKIYSKTIKTILNCLNNVIKAYYNVIIEPGYAWVLNTVYSLKNKELFNIIVQIN